MAIFALNEELAFPAPQLAEETGLLAVGGDLTPGRLLLAYASGIFPWNHPDDPLLWWSPDPRCVLEPGDLHISHSLAKKQRQGDYQVSFNQAFDQCVQGCATADERGETTWISNEIYAAYCKLHKLGYAHSVECWYQNELVGGLYGVAIGRCFCGESMFHTKTDASKIAFTALVRKLEELDYRLIDCQLPTDHLHSLGAKDISRQSFLEKLANCEIITEGRVTRGRFPYRQHQALQQ